MLSCVLLCCVIVSRVSYCCHLTGTGVERTHSFRLCYTSKCPAPITKGVVLKAKRTAAKETRVWLNVELLLTNKDISKLCSELVSGIPTAMRQQIHRLRSLLCALKGWCGQAGRVREHRKTQLSRGQGRGTDNNTARCILRRSNWNTGEKVFCFAI